MHGDCLQRGGQIGDGARQFVAVALKKKTQPVSGLSNSKTWNSRDRSRRPPVISLRDNLEGSVRSRGANESGPTAARDLIEAGLS